MKFKVGRYYKLVGHNLSTIGPFGIVVRCVSVSEHKIDAKPTHATGLIVHVPPEESHAIHCGDTYWMSCHFSKWGKVSDEEGVMHEMTAGEGP